MRLNASPGCASGSAARCSQLFPSLTVTAEPLTRLWQSSSVAGSCPQWGCTLPLAHCPLPQPGGRAAERNPGSNPAAEKQEVGRDAVRTAYLSQDIKAHGHSTVTPVASTNLQQYGADPQHLHFI